MTDLEIIKKKNDELHSRLGSKLILNPDLSRALVSFQANKTQQSYRWFKYKEGFSSSLINYILDATGVKKGKVLDPFAGAGTTLFVAAERGMDAEGIELLAPGQEIIAARQSTLNGGAKVCSDALKRWIDKRPWKGEGKIKPFNHLKITAGAFPAETEKSLTRFIAETEKEETQKIRQLLNFVALCVLEEISYTRKDGQYLRWDKRSGRKQGKRPFNKGHIKSFDEAIVQKLEQVCLDLQGGVQTDLQLFPTPTKYGTTKVFSGSCLDVLPNFKTSEFDCIITSPPYCNRYDYTRTYALELAMLGVNEEAIRKLRQTMLSCTVENREKTELEKVFHKTVWAKAKAAFESQECLQEILAYLEQRKKEGLLNNNGVPRMVKGYFWEMSLVIFECSRILKSGAPLVMVNDNVRYEGANIPVDLILSDIAEKAGFDVEKIWVLPTNKGNSSQQMGQWGRTQIRKCVYVWRMRFARADFEFPD
jgi:DNA modification methylase